MQLASPEGCIPCPAGYFCNSTAISQFSRWPCPIGYYCNIGTNKPTLCPKSTVTLRGGAANITDCVDCPPGFYCSNSSSVQKCPIGNFCPSNSVAPIPCPAGTYRNATEGEQIDDCHICPGGYYCPRETAVYFACTAGNFCLPGSANQSTCTPGDYCPGLTPYPAPCPAGFYCMNTTDLQVCPAAHFCPSYSMYPEPCPAGTYRNDTGAESILQCHLCPGGYYCSRATAVYSSCKAGFFCEPGSANQTICPPGYYCPSQTSYPVTCPGGFYCPQGSIAPVECYIGTYCPSGTSSPIPCPLGYYGADVTNHTSAYLGSLSSACLPCPPGYYGTDPQRLVCTLCTAGYVCEGATTSATPTNSSQNGYPCPPGSYCPAGSSAPSLCPAGRYEPYFRATNASQCIPCPVGSYQYLEGQNSCFHCSSSSTSLEGSTECTCIGKNRGFQPGDGFCICIPGYEFVNKDFVVSSQADGSEDCQPIVYARCSLPYSRNSYGSCVIPSDYCTQVCGVGGGSFSLTTGTCDCTYAKPLSVLCNASCRAGGATATCSNGRLLITDPITGSVSSVDPSLIPSYGSFDCSVSGSSVLSMSTSDGKFSGYFGIGKTLSNFANPSNRRRLWLVDDYALHFEHFDRILLGSSNSSSVNATSFVAVLPNPVVCIKVGDSIIFDVSSNDYPVYVKDSLLNTNPTFDYSAFRDIESLASKNVTITSFAFTFSQNGTYVFQLASYNYATTVVTVTPSSINCTTEAPFVTFSQKNLAIMGVSANSSIVLSPDWTLVIGLLFGMMGLIIIVVGFLYYFRKRAWSSHHEISVTYRTSNRSKPESTPTKGGLFSKPKILPGDPDALHNIDDDLEAKIPAQELDVEFDEDMQVPELARHMQTHHDEIDRRLIDQNDLLETLHASLKKEVDELKSLISASAVEMGGGIGDSKNERKIEALLTKMKSDLNSRAVFDQSLESSNARTLQLLERIMDSLRDGSPNFAREVTKEVVDKALKAYEYEQSLGEIESSLLHDFVEEIEYLVNFVVGTLLPGIENERRRMDNAERSLLHSLKDGNVEVSSEIISAFHRAMYADHETDAVFSDIIHSFKAFSERNAPASVEKLLSLEKLFVQTIAVDLHKGNLSVIEDDRDNAEKDMIPYLEDLRTEIEVLMQYSPAVIPKYTSALREAGASRAEVLRMIDRSLEQINLEKPKNVASSPIVDMAALAPLIEALKMAQAISPDTTSIFPRESEEREFDSAIPSDVITQYESQVVPHSEEYEEPDSSLNNISAESIHSFAELNEKVVEAMLNSDIDATQKEELFTATENGKILLFTDFPYVSTLDQAIIASILESETRQMEEMIKVATEIRPAVDDSEEDIARRYLEEQTRLQQQLQLEREQMLRTLSLESSMTDIIAEEGDSPLHADTELPPLLLARYAIKLRLHTLETRLDFAELQLRIEAAVSGTEKGDKFSLKQVASEEIEELLESCRLRRLALVDEERAFAEVHVENDMENDAAISALNSTVFATIGQFEKRLQENFVSREKLYEDICSANTESVKDDSIGFDPADREAVILRNEEECNKLRDINQTLRENDLRIFYSEKERIEEILRYMKSWSGCLNYRNYQSSLHDRIIAGKYFELDMLKRVVVIEEEFKREAVLLRTSTNLIQRGATRGEIEIELSNVNNGAKESRAVMLKEMEASKREAIENERLRLATNDLDYEQEYAVAVEIDCHRNLLIGKRVRDSHQIAWDSLRDAVQEKKAILMNILVAQKQPFILQSYLSKQIDFELMREDFEMRSVYRDLVITV